jgi:hypothetical protein
MAFVCFMLLLASQSLPLLAAKLDWYNGPTYTMAQAGVVFGFLLGLGMRE